MTQRIKKWVGWFEKIDDEICLLVSNRDIYREVQEIIDSNPKIKGQNLFHEFLGHTYIDYVLMAIRRQIKNNKDSLSFARLLNEIIETPCILTREWFTGLYPAKMQRHAHSDFSQFAGKRKDYVDPDLVKEDMEKTNKF